MQQVAIPVPFKYNVHAITITTKNREVVIEDPKKIGEVSEYFSTVIWKLEDDDISADDSCDVWLDFHNNTLVGIDYDTYIALWISKTNKNNSPFTASVTEEFVNLLMVWMNDNSQN